jgi:hypothetical protein
MTFDDLEFGERIADLPGSQALVFFANGYGASVIRGYGSYGADDELYELAVVKTAEDDSWDICYDSGITDDVIGHLSEEEITDILRQIEAL